MPAPRKYDQETRDRAVRMYQDRRRDFPAESALQARRRVGELLDVKPETLRGWIERAEIDAGQRPGCAQLGRGPDQGAGAGERRAAPGERDPQDGVGVFRRGGARPPTALIVDYIDAHRDRFGVEPICQVLSEHDVSIAPSSYYARKALPISDADWDDAHMANAALNIWRANRSVYGADKLATAMRKAGHDVGRDQVARLMKILGIEGVRRGRHRTVTTHRDPNAARHPDLIGRAWSTPTRPDQWWIGGLHLRVDPGGLRVHQLRHRRVLPADPRLAGLGLQGHPAGHVRARAGPVHPSPSRRPVHLQGPGPPLRRGQPVHGDQLHRGARRRRHRPLDRQRRRRARQRASSNPTIGLYKTELIEHPDRTHAWRGRAEVERETASWIHWYNSTRIHHSLGKMSPIEFEEHYRPANPTNIDEVA